MLLTRSSNSQASRHSDPCHSPPGTYRRVYHTLQIIFGWSLQGPHPLQAALRLLDPFGPPRISRRALKTSLRLPYDLLGPPFPPRLSKDPPKFPKKNPKARLARTEGTATLYKSFLCYSVHTRTRVFCRALKWEHPCSISMRPKNKGCPSVWVAVLGPIWTSLAPNVVIQRLVFCCQVFF